MYESILKELSQLNLDSSSGATIFIKRKDGILSKKFIQCITARLNHIILEEFVKLAIESYEVNIEAILLIIHYSSQNGLIHDTLLGLGEYHKSYEVLI